ncbi:MAG: hypothetical protein WKF31_13525 [Thermoleophilaceae bacterium]
MKRALFIAAVLMLVVPVAAQAATLTVDRAQRAALAEAQERADQEKDGRRVAVGECARRGARRVICRVSWEYTEEFDRRERIDCTVRDQHLLARGREALGHRRAQVHREGVGAAHLGPESPGHGRAHRTGLQPVLPQGPAGLSLATSVEAGAST